MDESFTSNNQRFETTRESEPKSCPCSISRPRVVVCPVEQEEQTAADGSAQEDVSRTTSARIVYSDGKHLTPPIDLRISGLPQCQHSKAERKSALDLLNDGCAVAYESGLMRQYHSPFVLHQSDCDPCQASPEDVDATDRFCYDCCESGHWSVDCPRKMATYAVWVGPDADEGVA